MPNAIDASSVTLWPASMPSTSNVGSASAYPSRCASARTVWNGRPFARISERMKLHVPLMMPAIHSMRFAAKPSRSALIVGMQPATAASKATITFCCRAAAKISFPCSASSALFAVTTCLPRTIAARIASLATVVPPITSTTMSISGLVTTARTSSTTGISGPDDRPGAFDVSRRDHRDLDAPPGAAGDLLAVAFQHVEGAARPPFRCRAGRL